MFVFSFDRWYEFAPNMSVGNDTDIITNVNPAYVRLMQETGGEYRLQVGKRSYPFSYYLCTYLFVIYLCLLL